MTINEIARMAGVSRATVSRYLNSGYVSAEKSERIRRVIEETGYRPSAQAQILRTKKTRLIGVVIPKINSDSISRMVAGISGVLSRSGYELLLANTDNNEKEEIKYLNMFASNNQVDGVILIGTILTGEHRKAIKNMRLPIVVLGQQVSQCSCVYYDDYRAARELTELLLRAGSRIGYIGVTQRDQAAGRMRRKGFEDALRAAGRKLVPEWTAEAKFRMDSGYEAARQIFERENVPDSLFCATDNIAIGAMLYLRDRGIDVPGEVQVAGIGDTEKARIVQPSLCTVHYYYKTSGEEAARLLLNLLNSEENVAKEIKMGYKIIENDSIRKEREALATAR